MFQYLTEQNKRAVLASSLILFIANLLPFIAVWKMNWSFYDLLVLYWTEVILVGVINIFRMALINPRESTMGFHLLKIAYVPFFAGHFGLFCVGIGLGLQVVFGKENFEVGNQILQMLSGISRMVFWPLVISHLFSFFWNYVSQREYRRTTILKRMVAPYLRTIPLLIFVVAASYACLHFKLPNWGLLALVLGKTLIDLIIHIIFHFRLMNQAEERPIITVRD
ncbi:MAG: DUF6498-containing protein [Verrucomicrobiales bacterium]|nr:DUF6498-containing protein [Verrucomicrobiales bacterium]